MFAAGARPVIYGTSSKPVEVETTETGIFQGRMLSESASGLTLKEQYRYVPTVLTKDPREKNNDWMMEREWRWALPYEQVGVPGLPFYLAPEYADFFSEVYVIVSFDKECIEITGYLKTLYDSKGTNLGLDYNVNMIAATKVITLESIANVSGLSKIIKIDTIPFNQIKLPTNFFVGETRKVEIDNAYQKACNIADAAIDKYLKEHPEYDDNKGDWGFVYVVTSDYTEVTQYLHESGHASTYSDGTYYLGQMSSVHPDNIDLLLEGAEAAVKYLREYFKPDFHVTWRLD